MTTNPYAPPTAIVADIPPPEASNSQPPFFAVSILKLAVLSVLTLGIYELYWFYKNWQLIKVRERTNISPAPRAIFAVLYCYQCFARIRDFDTPALAKYRLAAAPLALGWVVTTFLHKLPSPYWLVSFGAVVFLVPVQICANRINTAVRPDHNPNSRFTGWDWVVAVSGFVFVGLAVLGSFMPPN